MMNCDSSLYLLFLGVIISISNSIILLVRYLNITFVSVAPKALGFPREVLETSLDKIPFSWHGRTLPQVFCGQAT